MDNIHKYFPCLTALQIAKFEQLAALYAYWNAKINVISRKDIDNLYEHHVLHSLSIAKFINFQYDTNILDVGTGGGFPGIPLAIMFPHSNFTLIDSTGKKIKVATEIAKSISLNNVEIKQIRIEDEKGIFDFAVSRAVMPLEDLIKNTRKNISKKNKNAVPNGLIVLKGGELEHEILKFKNIAETLNICTLFREDFFQTKKIIYIPL